MQQMRLFSSRNAVAIKQLDRNGLQGVREFVVTLSLADHYNLVQLIGYCAEGEQRLLVYEFMPLGSLETHLLGTLERISCQLMQCVQEAEFKAFEKTKYEPSEGIQGKTQGKATKRHPETGRGGPESDCGGPRRDGVGDGEGKAQSADAESPCPIADEPALSIPGQSPAPIAQCPSLRDRAMRYFGGFRTSPLSISHFSTSAVPPCSTALCHFTRDKVMEGLLNISYVPTTGQLADILTKVLPSKQQDYILSKFGVFQPPT